MPNKAGAEPHCLLSVCLREIQTCSLCCHLQSGSVTVGPIQSEQLEYLQLVLFCFVTGLHVLLAGPKQYVAETVPHTPDLFLPVPLKCWD